MAVAVDTQAQPSVLIVQLELMALAVDTQAKPSAALVQLAPTAAAQV